MQEVGAQEIRVAEVVFAGEAAVTREAARQLLQALGDGVQLFTGEAVVRAALPVALFRGDPPCRDESGVQIRRKLNVRRSLGITAGSWRVKRVTGADIAAALTPAPPRLS